MKRISTATKEVDKFGAGKHGFRDGNKLSGILATDLDADWFNHVQEEISNVIETNESLDANSKTQLLDAIRALIAGGTEFTADFTTTGNITLSGLGTQGGGDWAGALIAGDKILVKNQSTASQNGWYFAAAGAWTRFANATIGSSIQPSNLTRVSEGATLADTIWMLTTDAPIVINTTNLVFAQKDAIDVPDASDTVKGIVELATIAETKAGTDATKAVTPDALEATVFGMGQTLTDVTGSRAVTTTYTNSTDKPIFVLVRGAIAAVGAPTFSVDGDVVSGYSNGFGDRTQAATFAVLVPPGSSYIVSTGLTLSSWFEFR